MKKFLASTRLWPPTAQWCWAVVKFQVVMCIFVHCCCTIGPRYQDINEDEMELFELARKILIFPLLLVCVFGIAEGCSNKPREQALVSCGVVILEFGVEITYYNLLSLGGLGFQNQRAHDYRPIYAARWIGWSVAIPMLNFMNLYPLVDNQPFMQVLARLCPQSAASAAYCWTCFLGSVVLDPWMGWTLNALGCLSYILVVVDEVCFVSDHLLATTMPALKGYSIIVKEHMFVFYTGVWLMGNGGFASSYACQRFYTVTDVSLKATMAMAFLLFLYLMCGAQKMETETETETDQKNL